MEPFWPYYAFLISWIQWFIVVWFAVSIETQSTDVYPLLDDNSTTAATDTTRSLVTFVSVVMPTCPPPGNLHLLCDVKISQQLITCKERADILELCFNRFSGIYNDSQWNECEKSCDEVVTLLKKLGLLIKTTTTVKPVTVRPIVTVPSVFPSANASISSNSSTTPSQSSTSSSNSSIPSSGPSTSTSNSTIISSNSTSVTISNSNSSSVTIAVFSSTTSRIMSTIAPPVYTSLKTPASMAGKAEPSEFPPLSWVYPLFGTALIVIEVIVLVYLFCYRGRKHESPCGGYRRTSTGSMVIQEDILEAETTSPTQALCNGPGNPALTDEAVFEEDQHIFRSYINLRYIDDTSNEGTPERIPVK